MKAFYRDKAGLLIKAYDQGDDWQLVSTNPDDKERWFSKSINHEGAWTSIESLKSAFERMNIPNYNASLLVVC
jgi:hypothetical protein